MKLSACIEMLFNDVDFYDRIPLAAKSGVSAIEFWDWTEKDIPRIADLTQEHGLAVATCIGSHGGAPANPAERKSFLEGLEASIPVAKQLGVPTLLITVMSPGQKEGFADLSDHQMHTSIVEGLGQAAPMVEEAGLFLAVEPLNVLVDHPGYYLTTSEEGFDILGEVGSPNVKLLFDIYHQQITEGNLLDNIIPNIGSISHFHVADVPGRHEPSTGEINYSNVFAAIEKTGYGGYVGLEYGPTGDTAESLKIVQALAP